MRPPGERRRLAVYVPRPRAKLEERLAPQSAIVGGAVEPGGRVLVCCEGNLHGAVNLRTFADRVAVAASRLLSGHRAMVWVPWDELVQVGEYWTDQRRLEVWLPDVLATWLGLGVEQLEEELRFSR